MMETFPKLHDPLLVVIQQYNAGLAAYSALTVEELAALDEDEVINETYAPALAVLAEWDQPAMTFEGALAALKYIRDGEGLDLVDTRMMKAALAYFEGQTEAK